jgi:alkylation response protein AidB-like acyl-CoA dehydrogenase
MSKSITNLADDQLVELSEQLRQLAGQLDKADSWPGRQLDLCGEYGVFEWFVTRRWGGQEWSEAEVMRGYLALSSACLTTTFVITQRTGACRRIDGSDNEFVQSEYLPDLLTGKRFATVGISHLTTSRQHLSRPVLRAEETASGFVLDGYCPWVTGASYADLVVTGATLEDGRQVLAAVPTDLPGVSSGAAADLVGLSASQTGPMHFERVEVDRRWLLGGPIEQVLKQGGGGNTGGLQTSALALGVSKSALDFLGTESERRPDLQSPTESLQADWDALRTELLHAAEGEPVCSLESLRTQANSLALRSTQAALVAAKGAGYVVGHPAGRGCREALFFLVWSCPQPVLAANLCELAGISQ